MLKAHSYGRSVLLFKVLFVLGNKRKSVIEKVASGFSLVILGAFFMGPYYWPGSGAAWAAFVRTSAFFALFLFLLSGFRLRDTGTLGVASLLLLVYLLLNSMFVGQDAQSARRVVYIFCFVFMVAGFWKNPEWPRLLLPMIALVAGFFAAFSLINLYRLGVLNFSYRNGAIFSAGVPDTADFGNTIVAAMHYTAGYCAALWSLFASRSRYSAIFWSLCLAVIGLYIVMTFSRTGWVACLVASLVLAFVALRDDEYRRKAFMALSLIALLVFVFLVTGYFSYEINERGLTHRDEIWKVMLSRIKSNWLLGHGGGTDIQPIPIVNGRVFVHNAHNLYLEVLYHFGAVGLVLKGVVLFMAMRRLFWSSMSERYMHPASFGFALLSASAVIMLVELNSFVSAPNLVWIWFWLPLGIALSVSKGKNVTGCST